MAGTANASWWQYSRWVYLIGRSLRLNTASSGERSAVETFIGLIGDPSTGTRTWLAERLRIKGDYLNGGGEPIHADQPDYNEAKMIMVIGRDLKKIPLTDTEKGYVDTLIAATGNRRYGDKSNAV